MAEFTTILRDLRVMIRLGIHPHEAEPQPVTITVEMTVRYPAAPTADSIAEVLDYDFIRDGIRAMAADERFALQETLCDRIAALCLADPRVTRVSVTTMKTDIYSDAGIGCSILRGRGGAGVRFGGLPTVSFCVIQEAVEEG